VVVAKSAISPQPKLAAEGGLYFSTTCAHGLLRPPDCVLSALRFTISILLPLFAESMGGFRWDSNRVAGLLSQLFFFDRVLPGLSILGDSLTRFDTPRYPPYPKHSLSDSSGALLPPGSEIRVGSDWLNELLSASPHFGPDLL
jgi:hypothetical protein